MNPLKVYKMLIANKPQLETLLLRVSDGGLDGECMPKAAAGIGPVGPGGQQPPPVSNSYVNSHIQMLAQKYCGDCRASFEELSKIIQRVMATRKELLQYDNNRRGGGGGGASATPVTAEDRAAAKSSGKCFGCASAAVEHLNERKSHELS